MKDISMSEANSVALREAINLIHTLSNCDHRTRVREPSNNKASQKQITTFKQGDVVYKLYLSNPSKKPRKGIIKSLATEEYFNEACEVVFENGTRMVPYYLIRKSRNEH